MTNTKSFILILLFCLPLSAHFAFAEQASALKQPSPTLVQPTADETEKKIPYSSLTPAEVQILKDGEISHDAHVAGGIIGTIFGLGIGQAIQGRYWPSGFVITAGEIGSFALLIAGANDCLPKQFGDPAPKQCHGDYIAAGLLAYLGFRVFELIDVWAAPDRINRRYWDLKDRVEGSAYFSILPATKFASSTVDGGVLQVQLRF